MAATTATYGIAGSKRAGQRAGERSTSWHSWSLCGRVCRNRFAAPSWLWLRRVQFAVLAVASSQTNHEARRVLQLLKSFACQAGSSCSTAPTRPIERLIASCRQDREERLDVTGSGQELVHLRQTRWRCTTGIRPYARQGGPMRPSECLSSGAPLHQPRRQSTLAPQ